MIKLTDIAQDKVRNLLGIEGRDDFRLRLAVQPGGCSGLIHQMYFDNREMDGDDIIDFDGFEVVIDKMSGPYLDDATVDFADSIEQQGFTLTSDSMTDTCACGGSFA